MTRLRTILAPAPIDDCIDPGGDSSLRDFRFRALLGSDAWSCLPAAIRQRFSKRMQGGEAVTYVGEIVESRRTTLGHLLAQMGRVIGAPLPLYADVAVPAIVTVTEDAATGGQFWTRIYAQARGFPQVVHSSKRFAGPTGLEEYLGCGFGIALTVSADEHALRFHSDHYFIRCAWMRLRVPRWLAPGALTISHVDRGGEWFAFDLTLSHPLLGELVGQTAYFRERLPYSLKEVPHD